MASAIPPRHPEFSPRACTAPATHTLPAAAAAAAAPPASPAGAASVAASALAPAVSLGNTPSAAHRKPKVPMMLLVIVTSFVSATTYALCFPSLAPYLVELDPQAGQLLLGLSVAIFSLTKALAAPIVGRVVGVVGTQAPLVALVLLLAASQVLYALASSAWMVVVSRALMGAASTTSTVCRTAVAMNVRRLYSLTMTALTGSATFFAPTTVAVLTMTIFTRSRAVRSGRGRPRR